MSKINALRLINLNYNNDAIRISDETFYMNGQSTLLSLRNGGGKTVLVQMMSAPFVHKRYRDTKDRPFESYFTGSKPTFILVEWVLDQGAGYVLTGMMVRRSQDDSEDAEEEKLEIVNFISEYREGCEQDIYHLPVVEKTKKEILLKSFPVCRQLFESYKKDPGKDFFYYDMGNSAQARQYFEKLKEYQIDHKEWETIIKKVNLKESGLSDLFADCKDEKGLVEKWFLDAVESKLNKDRNRMQEFQKILEKYVGQYKDNRSKIKRRDTIRKFKEQAEQIAGKAENYDACTKEVRKRLGKIAIFREALSSWEEACQNRAKEVTFRAEKLEEEKKQVEYARFSDKIQRLRMELRKELGDREILEMEREDLEKQCLSIEKALHCLECAHIGEELDESRREYERVKQQLKISKRQDEDLEPERKKLGGQLKQIYELLLEKNGLEQVVLTEKKEDCFDKQREEKDQIEEFRNKEAAFLEELGRIRAMLASFNEKEASFNRQYQTGLRRNLLGEYEPGELEIKGKTLEKELEECKAFKKSQCQRREALEEDKRRIIRQITEKREEEIRLEGKLSEAEKEKEGLEGEIAERRVILKYLGLTETVFYDREAILRGSDAKIQEIEAYRRQLQKEEDELQKEYERLTKGKVLDLSEEFAQLLEELGINAVFGMEYLKQNGNTALENAALVKKHPFLPYALIMTAKELQKLSEADTFVYTSLPIPIVVRESLSKEETQEGRLCTFPSVSFYVLFNENLLDEEKLAQLVKKKEEELEQKKEALKRRTAEQQEYLMRKSRILAQRLTKELVEETENEIRDIESRKENLTVQVRTLTQELSSKEEEGKNLQSLIEKTDREILFQEGRLTDFGAFRDAYGVYQENRQTKERLTREQKRLENRRKLSEERLQKLFEEGKSLEAAILTLFRQAEELSKSAERYREYEPVMEGHGLAQGKETEETGRQGGREEDRLTQGREKEEASQQREPKNSQLTGYEKEEIESMEARFLAITASFSADQRFLEEQLLMTRRHFDNVQERLKKQEKKYGLTWKDYSSVSYSEEEEAHKEALYQERIKKKQRKDQSWHEKDKTVGILEEQIKEQLRALKEQLQKEEPLRAEEIPVMDFQAKLREISFEQNETKKEKDALEKRQALYARNCAALAEFDDIQAPEEEKAEFWEQEGSKELPEETLQERNGMLVRDYREALTEKAGAKDALTGVLNRIVRMEEFQDYYYKRPLENMLELTEDAQAVLGQLHTTIQAYDQLMEKLEVDISLVEKEKQRIVELLEDYVREVHENLGKIDRNSTIKIREKSVKMLKLQLPIWEENENLYEVRLKDYMEELTKRGLEIFDKNENATEYFGTKLTTRNLYDQVVGIGNVQVRLYKIEEQREYPITWAEVAKNSGGEGFLSAFVILSSLLYYMRKDESDLFADRNEGKVLVMDNPFAQTNAAHLLKPLMDMADKTNTQLICLSGLGGESIYSRFQNIYVLNLVAASLRGGMQYLKAEHTRGEEPETMVLSRVQVVDSQELLF